MPFEKLIKRNVKRYGWRPDLPDRRDHFFRVSPQILAALPAKVDLRSNCPPVGDQGELGSCTAFAVAAAIMFEQQKRRAEVIDSSRLFIYYNSRVIDDTESQDVGATIRDAVKSVTKAGAPLNELWPYEIAKFAEKPPDEAYTDGEKRQAVRYQRVRQDLNQIRGTLAMGFPIVFGFSVFESFASETVAKSGIVPWPKSKEKNIGGHASLIVGYDDSVKRVSFENSYGVEWGNAGFGEMPYNYVLDDNMSADFWAITLTE
jgi:C1A family cysteine protease